MAFESIGSVLGSQDSQVQQTSLGQEDLFKILLTQLSYQDPLKPLDNQEFMAQMAQFTTLEQSRQSNDKLDSLITVQASTQSIGLLGRTVEVNTDGGNVVGDVTTISFDQGSPVMTIRKTDGTYLNNVSLSQIYVVR
jgi:flagellar basal-body rod modification protein FlgD